MHKMFFVACFMCLSVSGAMAQGKIDAQWNCGSYTDSHIIQVGDQPGHATMVGQFSCTATKGEIEGVKEKDGVATECADVMGDNVESHGVMVETLVNGDKIYLSYTGTATLESGMMQSGRYTLTATGGTGKFKGLTGKATCNGKGNTDGTSTFNCVGDYKVYK